MLEWKKWKILHDKNTTHGLGGKVCQLKHINIWHIYHLHLSWHLTMMDGIIWDPSVQPVRGNNGSSHAHQILVCNNWIYCLYFPVVNRKKVKNCIIITCLIFEYSEYLKNIQVNLFVTSLIKYVNDLNRPFHNVKFYSGDK